MVNISRVVTQIVIHEGVNTRVQPDVLWEEREGLVIEATHILWRPDYHVHVAIYEPEPLPTIEETAVAHIEQSGMFGYDGRYDETTYKKLYEAVQREKEK